MTRLRRIRACTPPWSSPSVTWLYIQQQHYYRRKRPRHHTHRARPCPFAVRLPRKIYLMPATFSEAVQEAAHAIVTCMSEIECVERGLMAALERRRRGVRGLGAGGGVAGDSGDGKGRVCNVRVVRVVGSQECGFRFCLSPCSGNIPHHRQYRRVGRR